MMANSGTIHPTAIISERAHLGENVSVGPFSIIHEGVTIGSGTQIGSHCEIGVWSKLAKENRLVIQSNSVIRSHSVLYLGSSFGNDFVTGHHVTIRENTFAGVGFQVGTLGDIQGDCVLGDYVRLHSNVHIGKGSVIGDFVWIFPYVVLTNDPLPPSEICNGVTVEDYAVIATMSTILPGVRIGFGSLVGAGSLVTRDVPKEMVVIGVPAKQIGSANNLQINDEGNNLSYPWRKHFHRGYPTHKIEEWKLEFE
jgi:acetyltransferase-like isoleucine patch superfamily enzyme